MQFSLLMTSGLPPTSCMAKPQFLLLNRNCSCKILKVRLTQQTLQCPPIRLLSDYSLADNAILARLHHPQSLSILHAKWE